MLVSARKHFGEAVFVVVRHGGHRHVIQIDFVLPVKRTTPNAKFKQGRALFSWGDQQHVEVGGRSRKSVKQCHHKSAHAIQARFFRGLPVEFTQKGVPGFRCLARVWHEGDSPPSSPSTDSNARLQERGSRADIFSPRPSAHRGTKYLSV